MGNRDLSYKKVTELPGVSSVLSTDDILSVSDDDGAVKTNSQKYSGSNGFLRCTSSGDLTISGGEITVTGSSHRIDTEGGAASDTLDTINGLSDGDWLYLHPVDFGRLATISSAGNINPSVLPATVNKLVPLQKKDGFWNVMDIV